MFAFEVFNFHLKFPFQLLEKRATTGRSRRRSRSPCEGRGGSKRRSFGDGRAFPLLLLRSRLG